MKIHLESDHVPVTSARIHTLGDRNGPFTNLGEGEGAIWTLRWRDISMVVARSISHAGSLLGWGPKASSLVSSPHCWALARTPVFCCVITEP